MIASNSMYPVLEYGDVILVEETNFDDIKKGKNTQQFLTGELLNIKSKIEKLPKDSYHRQHFEQ